MARAARWLGLLLCCVAGTSAVSLTTASSGLVYEPDVDFHGSDEITVTVRSAAGEFASAAVPVVIEAANDAPELAGVAAARDAAAALDVVAGGGARAAWAPAPAKTLRLRAAPHRLRDLLAACGVTYAPPDVAGADALTARADDGALRSALATFPSPSARRGRPSSPRRGAAAGEDGAAALNLTLVGGAPEGPFLRLSWTTSHGGAVALRAQANATEFPRGEFRASGRNAVALAHPRQLRDLVASGALVYTPARPGLEFATFSLTAVATFDGEAAGEATSATCGVTSAPVNDVPRLLGPLWRGAATYRADDAEWFTDEDVPAAVRGVVVADADAGDAADGEGVAVFLAAHPPGSALVLGGAPAGVRISTASGGGAWPAASAALNVSGSLDGVNRALDGLRYVPPPHFDGLGVIDFVAEDAHGARDAAAAVIRVAFVDDAPTFDLGPAVDGATGAVDALEDAAVRLGGGLRSGIGADARRTPSPRVAAFSDADSTAASLVISLSADDAAVAFALVGDHPDVILDDGELRGLAGDLAVAFDDVELLPAPDWHGFARVALSVAAAEDEAAILASTSFLLRVRALQDAPAVVDGFHGAREVDEDAPLALTGVSVVDADYDDGPVASVKDAPRITAPATVRYAEAFRGVALGRNGTKRETPVAGVEFEDPDSDVLAVTVVAAGGGVRTVDRVPDVDYGDDLWSERGAVVRRATLRASPERLNAALSTLAWVGDDAAGDKDGLVAGAITITATDGDGLETTATIALEASAFNDAPVLSSDLRSAEFAEDSGWAALPAVAATDFDDATLELRAAARPEGALEVHEIRTAANGGARAPAVHVISVSNASNASDPVGDGGFYVTVDLRHVPRLPPGAATRETTGLIRFDAVARIDDERRGARAARAARRPTARATSAANPWNRSSAR
ncbi:hypothetical protein JL720_1096 [Aureococcus anophagefferens]|nr:hypothetical protein JL720_1096 [Aureococcus anophagefferens]